MKKLDEISKKTLLSYIPKAQKSAKELSKKSNAAYDSISAVDDPEGYPEKRKAADKIADKALKRASGVYTAKFKTNTGRTKTGYPSRPSYYDTHAHRSETYGKNQVDSKFSGVGTNKRVKVMAKEETMNEATLIGESIDCLTLGEGTIIDVDNNTAKIYLEEFETIIELSLNEILAEDEDQEELEELSKSTLGSYIKQAARWSTVDAAHSGSLHRARKDTKLDQRTKGINMAVNKLTKEETEELEEARGRPPKQPKEGEKPTAAWLRHLERQKQGQDKEEIEALGAQLRKSISINKPVTFLNGEKKEVNPRHAERFEDHMEARPKTIDKQKFQNAAHASHDEFVKHVTAPLPKPEGGKSSIVKYR